MANIAILPGSQDFQANIVANIFSSAGVSALEKLEGHVAAGAIHDSAERCDAPKCQEETRVAVQDDLYDWIIDGDGALEHPKKIKGPAGCGKTAIMGSLAGRCAANGVLGATFFFASWSASIGRRRKTALVTTIARQLAEHRDDLKDAISSAIEKNPCVFEKNLHVQMEILVRTPRREVALQPDRPHLRGAIIIDGVDECEAEQYHIHDGSRANPPPARANQQDQLEILQVLQAASSDPSFPFRILIASRPERVFRTFFDPRNTPTPFAHKLDLHDVYNADDDITLFFEVQFNRLRRRYYFPPSWPLPGTIETLVENASGQFIYAATVIRLLETAHRDPPEALLKAILAAGATQKTTSSLLEQLDALYTHILESSPDPPLSVRWIRSVNKLNGLGLSSASNVRLLLQTDPESNEAEHLLGNLHSLILIPPPSDQATTQYDFYHKSLFDFLEDPARCVNQQKLYVEENEIQVFIWDRFVQACMRGCNTQLSFPDSFLRLLTYVPVFVSKACAIPHSKAHFTPAGGAWWVSLAITYEEYARIWEIFRFGHQSVRAVLNLFQSLD